MLKGIVIVVSRMTRQCVGTVVKKNLTIKDLQLQETVKDTTVTVKITGLFDTQDANRYSDIQISYNSANNHSHKRTKKIGTKFSKFTVCDL